MHASAYHHTYLVRHSRPSLALFMLSQLYGGPCSPPQEPGPGGGQPDVLFLWLKKWSKGKASTFLEIIKANNVFQTKNNCSIKYRLAFVLGNKDKQRPSSLIETVKTW